MKLLMLLITLLLSTSCISSDADKAPDDMIYLGSAYVARGCIVQVREPGVTCVAYSEEYKAPITCSQPWNFDGEYGCCMPAGTVLHDDLPAVYWSTCEALAQ